MKRLFIGVSILVLILPLGMVSATVVEDRTVPQVTTVPDWAAEVAPGVFYLGAVSSEGAILEGFAIVHYDASVRKPDRACGFGKPGTECGNGVCEPGENAKKCPADCGGNGGTSDCYAFFAKGAKWRTVENWLLNPANDEGLSASFILSNLHYDIGKWEEAAGVDILGTGSFTNQQLEADFYEPDGLNEVYFGDVADPGAIAVTVVWGYFSGPPWARELLEWDQVYDQADYDWSSSGEANKMDFENIATHELGHSVGLDDLYTTDCSEQTMYGYASEGETKKRTLEDGDIAGVKTLYA
ncbi:MAG: matrixin family metalloprotease [Thermoplasmata archaeon]